MRNVQARCVCIKRRTVMRVTSVESLAAKWRPGLSWLVCASEATDIAAVERIARGGLGGLTVLKGGSDEECSALPTVYGRTEDFEEDDVVAATPDRSYVQVLYRASDIHHTVFLTNRCNSYCLMCSQPPTPGEDSWLVEEAKQVAKHIDPSPQVVGFTGGEPLLLGGQLRDVLDAFALYHPSTRLEILTNARLLCDTSLSVPLLTGISGRVTWMVPLYGHADFLHDFVVQSHGAFNETVDGILTLQQYKQPVQIRTVLIEPVLQILPEMCHFIARNLPFVQEVALMGCEPIGFALANRHVCQVDITNWCSALIRAVRELRRADLTPVLMNLPLCALPAELRPYAHRSISDWKQVYAPECDGCAARVSCCGLFAWYKKGWVPTTIQPIKEAA
jgi:His-Xaa-Ser system radical SAM maturase HxsC